MSASGTACGTGADPATPEAVARAEQNCENGDKVQCGDACRMGGSFRACKRGCEANIGDACEGLAGRIEAGEDGGRYSGVVQARKITHFYAQACQLKVGRACRRAGERILSGKGPGSFDGATGMNFLKRGCEKLKDAEACCGMVHLNIALARSGGISPSEKDEFAKRARRWWELAELYRGVCSRQEPPAEIR